MRVGITYSHEDQTILGTIEYIDGTVIIDIEDVVAHGLIADYLNRPQQFFIPESQEIDDYRVDTARPIDNETYFNLALCTMYHTIGVWVNWETEEE